MNRGAVYEQGDQSEEYNDNKHEIWYVPQGNKTDMTATDEAMDEKGGQVSDRVIGCDPNA